MVPVSNVRSMKEMLKAARALAIVSNNKWAYIELVKASNCFNSTLAEISKHEA